MSGYRARMQSWLRAVIARRRFEAEMEEEMSFHLEARAADLARGGLDAHEARRRARVEFGGIASHKQEMRRSLGLGWWYACWVDLGADLLYGARLLRKSPGFTIIAVLSLALAIGANTTIFSLANEVLYARLGVPQADQLRLLTLLGDQHAAVHSSWGSDYLTPAGVYYNSFTYPVYQQLRHQNQAFGDGRALEDIFAFKENFQANVTVDGAAQSVRLELVSGNLYQQMRVHPALGRAILPSDDGAPGTGTVAVISYGFWERAFGRAPDAVGKVITVNMTPVTIVGINPAGFTGAQSVQSSPEIFMPLSMIPLLRSEIGHDGPYLSSPTLWWVQLMARARPAVSTAQAQAALNVAFNAAVRGTVKLEAEDTVPRLVLEDGSRGLNAAGRQYAQPIHVLLALVGLVLLLACANIANLMLARASARQREMAVRLALGAARGRLLRQVLTESLMLSAMGGALGLLLAFCGRSLMPKLLLNPWERADMTVPFDWRVFCFTAAVTLATGVLFGLAPAWAGARAEISTVLKEGGKSATRRAPWSIKLGLPGKGLGGKFIVIFQVALSTLLVVGAGLFLRTLMNLNSIHPGFRADHLVLFDINPPSQQYSAAQAIALHRQIEAALRSVPGVTGVTLSDVPLLADSQSRSSFYVEGAQKGKGEPAAMEANVGQSFLEVMGIPLVAGRGFTLADTDSPQPVAVVSQALARKYFPHQNPLGQRFSMDDDGPRNTKWFEIVGVFGDIRYAHLKEPPPPLHLDLYQHAQGFGGVTYIVRTDPRTEATPDTMAASLRAAVQRIDRNLPLLDVRTQQQQIDATMQQERMFASLTLGFGILALALACVGIYGIMAYTVAQRINEIGIRLALGARRGQVRGMVLRDAGLLGLLGTAGGVGAALILGRIVGSMLYGLQPWDPASVLGAAGLLLLVALLAGWLPAMRASRVQPMEALRHE